MKWDDLDFEINIPTLQGEHAKNSRTEHIPMPASVKEIFQNVARTDSPYVFPGKDGKMRQDFRTVARRVRDKAGLPADFRPVHALCHVYASFMVSNGISLYTLQKLLTHQSPNMTKRYAHMGDDALQKAASFANEMLDPQ